MIYNITISSIISLILLLSFSSLLSLLLLLLLIKSFELISLPTIAAFQENSLVLNLIWKLLITAEIIETGIGILRLLPSFVRLLHTSQIASLSLYSTRFSLLFKYLFNTYYLYFPSSINRYINRSSRCSPGIQNNLLLITIIASLGNLSRPARLLFQA